MAGCGASLARIVLVVVNIIFVLLGLGLAIAGLVFKFDNDLFAKELKVVLENVHLDMVGGVNTYSLIESLSNLFIIIGFIIFAIGFLGCCGACCQWKWMLVVYAILVIILLIAQIAAIALFASFKGEIDDSFSKEATKTLKENYSKAGKEDFTTGFNKMFDLFDCCGINNCTDVPSITGLTLPKECCDKSPCTCPLNTYPGCFTKLDDNFKKYETAFIAVSVAILLFQLLCVTFAFCLCRAIGKEGTV